MDVRERMAYSAMVLLSRQGYQATSFSEVLEHSSAPRGSVYHHFPGGKDELIEAALALTLAGARASLLPLHGRPLAEVLDRFAGWWQRILAQQGLQYGCPVMAVSVGAGDNERLQRAVRETFGGWTDDLTALLRSVPEIGDEATARLIAVHLLAGYEGALALGRAERSLEAFAAADRGVRAGALALAGSRVS